MSHEMTNAEIVAELCAARTAWHEANGVPISFEYAHFLEAIGAAQDRLSGKPVGDSAAPSQPQPHSSQIYTDLTVRCHHCRSTLIWRYFEEKDEIEVFHNCKTEAAPSVQPEPSK